MIMDISELYERNPWWHDPRRVQDDMHIGRALESEIYWRPKIFKLNELDRDAVYTLRGPRQVGKPTYLKFIVVELLRGVDDPRRVLYLSCDPLESVSDLRGTLLNYLRWIRGFSKERLYLILDEVTRINNWQLAIKDLIDHNYLENSVVIACGSHSLDVRRGAELLPGRRGNYVPPPDRILYPMSFRQFVNAYDPRVFSDIESRVQGKKLSEAIEELRTFQINLESLFDKYLITGGFPAPISNFKKNLERTIDVHPYNDLKYYISGDIVRAEKNPELAKKIINAIIDTMSNPVSINKIAREANCDPKTAQDYIYVLESMFIVLTVPFPNVNYWTPLERKMKKIYIFDPFLVYAGKHMLLEDEDPFKLALKTLNAMKPKILELVVGNHLRRLASKLFYWRTSKNKEVDFIVPKKDVIIGVEVKETPRRRDLPHVLAILNRMPRGGQKIAIVTGLTKDIVIADNEIILPIPLFLYIVDKLL